MPPKDVGLSFHELGTAPRGPSNGGRGKRMYRNSSIGPAQVRQQTFKKRAVDRWIVLLPCGEEDLKDTRKFDRPRDDVIDDALRRAINAGLLLSGNAPTIPRILPFAMVLTPVT
jgi:hypothetical protein